MKNPYVAVDFDGTCVEHLYPEIGAEIGAVRWLLSATHLGAQLLLHTMRDGERLREAIGWFERHGIPLAGANKNPTQHHWTSSPKVYASIYIDDAALGTPLICMPDRRPYVDWQKAGPELLRLIAEAQA